MRPESKPVSLREIKKDEYAYAALPAVTGYKPSDEDCTIETVTDLYNEMQTSRTVEIQKQGELKAAHDKRVAAEHTFHNVMLKVKNQIRAQFGENSDQIQFIGLKKKSERKAIRRTTVNE